METITIEKAELKTLIKEVLHEELSKTHYDFVSDTEQQALEAEFGKAPSFDDEVDEVVRL